MVNVADQLDEIEARVMNGLKDFQKATVNRIAQLYRNGQRRVLVSDEVGLGKTLIARGTVAQVARLRHDVEHDDLFKVVYICSNGAIADQNLQKLRISHGVRTESVSSSRLTMQHLNIFNQENDAELLNHYIQLIPLTPDTSFRMTAGAGMVGERALMYALLSRMTELQDYLPELSVAMMNDAYKAWEGYRAWYEKAAEECNQKSGGKYYSYMLQELRQELNQQDKTGRTYLDGIISLCLAIRKNQGKRVSENQIIGQLRVIFAKISLKKLEPDLVIMDEFQRFKYLISSDAESETGMLANKFFHSKNVRMLLLSATPYKMYSTPEEIDESRIDEHYTEFLDVMRFLNDSEEAERKFITVWRDYSIKLKELTIGDSTILKAKEDAEDAIYQSVCRTERLSEKENSDIIDDSDVHQPLLVSEQDISSYVQAQKLLDEIGANCHVPVDYVKSCPYLLSFMRDYQLKKTVERYFRNHPEEIQKLNKNALWLNRLAMDRYNRIPNNNARLERVMDTVLSNSMENLLWMPPSRPYYELQGVFKGQRNASKTLIFSSWEMVPRMLASMISYEAERRTVGKLAKEHQAEDVHYFYTGEKRYPAARMSFSVKDDNPAAMTLFCLIYPSQFLSDCYDPIACMNSGMTLRDIQRQIRERIKEKLDEFPSPETGDGRRWYYLAPLLLDGAETACRWMNEDAVKLSAYDEEDEKTKRQKGFKTHLDALRDRFEEAQAKQFSNLGRRPDDLLDVLTDMALASPAVCINRTYRHYVPDDEAVRGYLPSQLARVFINRMNTAEATAAVELACGRKSDDAHWENLLTYCRQGNLQAVFDEYAHMISSGIDHDKTLVEQIHERMKEAMDIRTTLYGVDTYRAFQKRMESKKERPTNIRTHFAVAFTKGEGRESDTDRKKVIRNAFNSPFRPFVLATTSIGQEGLDFHFYCRKIVHWNLPSNPIDLEQREGRINRFKCLAIRQNIAMRYGNIRFSRDIWDEMFKEAVQKEKAEGTSDLIPFWGLQKRDDMVRIERFVPMYPFSRDGMAYEHLIKILSLYRLTLGQARQEELLEYLFKNFDDPQKLRDLFINLSPFYRISKRVAAE